METLHPRLSKMRQVNARADLNLRCAQMSEGTFSDVTARVSLNPFKPSVPLKRTLANSVDPDQTPQNAASDQGLHCLH